MKIKLKKKENKSNSTIQPSQFLLLLRLDEKIFYLSACLGIEDTLKQWLYSRVKFYETGNDLHEIDLLVWFGEFKDG